MNDSHPPHEQLDRFFLGKTSADENRAIVLHLLRGCPECRKFAGAIWYRTESAMAKLILVALPREVPTLEKRA